MIFFFLSVYNRSKLNFQICGLKNFFELSDKNILSDYVFKSYAKYYFLEFINNDNDGPFLESKMSTNDTTIDIYITEKLSLLLNCSLNQIRLDSKRHSKCVYDSKDYDQTYFFLFLQILNTIKIIFEKNIIAKNLFFNAIQYDYFRKIKREQIFLNQSIVFFKLPIKILFIEFKYDEFIFIEYFSEFMHKVSILKNDKKKITYVRIFEQIDDCFYFDQNELLRSIMNSKKTEIYDLKTKIINFVYSIPNISIFFYIKNFNFTSNNTFKCKDSQGFDCQKLNSYFDSNFIHKIQMDSNIIKNLYVGNNLDNSLNLKKITFFYDQILKKNIFFSLFKKKITIVIDNEKIHNHVKNKNLYLLNSHEMLFLIYRAIFHSIKLYFANLLKICLCVKEFNDFLDLDFNTFLQADFEYTEKDLRYVFDKLYNTDKIIINFFSGSDDFLVYFKNSILVDDINDFYNSQNYFLYKNIVISAIFKSIFKLVKPNVFYSSNPRNEVYNEINVLNSMKFLHLTELKHFMFSAINKFNYTCFTEFLICGIEIHKDRKDENLIYFYSIYLDQSVIYEVKSINIKALKAFDMSFADLIKINDYCESNMKKITVFLEFKILKSDSKSTIEQSKKMTENLYLDSIIILYFNIIVEKYSSLSKWINFAHFIYY